MIDLFNSTRIIKNLYDEEESDSDFHFSEKDDPEFTLRSSVSNGNIYYWILLLNGIISKFILEELFKISFNSFFSFSFRSFVFSLRLKLFIKGLNSNSFQHCPNLLILISLVWKNYGEITDFEFCHFCPKIETYISAITKELYIDMRPLGLHQCRASSKTGSKPVSRKSSVTKL